MAVPRPGLTDLAGAVGPNRIPPHERDIRVFPTRCRNSPPDLRRSRAHPGTVQHGGYIPLARDCMESRCRWQDEPTMKPGDVAAPPGFRRDLGGEDLAVEDRTGHGVPPQKPLPPSAQRDLERLSERFGRQYSLHVFEYRGEIAWTAAYRDNGEHGPLLDERSAEDLRRAIEADLARRALPRQERT